MNTSLSPGKSSDLKQTFTFFSLGLLGLSLCAFYWLDQHTFISDRWSSSTIVLLHLFTIGFLMPVFLGAMTQLLPVLFGIEIDFNKIFKSMSWTVSIALVFFAYHFHRGNMEKNYLLVLILGFLWYRLYRFIYYVSKRSWELYQQQKKIMHLLLCIGLLNLSIGLFFSFWLIMVHFGVPLPLFRPFITDSHFLFMVLGFFFHILLAVANNVIPMFFVTHPISDDKLKLAVTITPLLLAAIFSPAFPFLHILLKFIISSICVTLLFFIARQLKVRKRKSWDPIVTLWNLFLFNAGVSLILWNIPEVPEMELGKMIFLGGFLPLILSMLLRIIPFLIWNKLSQQQLESMNFSVQLPHMKSFMPNNAVWALAGLSQLCLILALTDYYRLAALILAASALIIFILLINALKLSQNTLNSLTEVKES